MKTVLIMAGGTGGHVFPALSIARELKARGIAVSWLGTRSGIEAKWVREAGFPITYIPMARLRGQSWVGRLGLPFRLMGVFSRVFFMLRKCRPDVVVGMGGYVSGPGGVVARLLGIPLVIHEQNAIPGLTNRWLAKITPFILCAFPQTFGADCAVTVTGNPVCQAIAAVDAPSVRFKRRATKALRLLILGGSQGAQPINERIPEVVRPLVARYPMNIWHQAGAQWMESLQLRYQALGIDAKVEAFIHPIAEAYAWADVVLCRAGAMTLAELMAVGVASILVPLPSAADNHQRYNAEYLVAAGAAILLPQHSLYSSADFEQVADLFSDLNKRIKMSKIARDLSRPDANNKIVDYICKLL